MRLAESFDASTWHGLVAPAGAPPEIVAKLHDAAIKRCMTRRAGFARQARRRYRGDTPDEFNAYIASEIPKWTAIVKASGATMENQ